MNGAWNFQPRHGETFDVAQLTADAESIYWRIAARRAPQRRSLMFSREDMVQVALLAACRAWGRWTPETGGWRSFAWRRMHGAMLDELRRLSWGSRTGGYETVSSLNVTANVDGETREELELLPCDDSHRQALVVFLADAKRAPLTPAERYVLGGSLADVPGAEIAQNLGVSKSRVSQITRNIERKVAA